MPWDRTLGVRFALGRAPSSPKPPLAFVRSSTTPLSRMNHWINRVSKQNPRAWGPIGPIKASNESPAVSVGIRASVKRTSRRDRWDFSYQIYATRWGYTSPLFTESAEEASWLSSRKIPAHVRGLKTYEMHLGIFTIAPSSGFCTRAFPLNGFRHVCKAYWTPED